MQSPPHATLIGIAVKNIDQNCLISLVGIFIVVPIYFWTNTWSFLVEFPPSQGCCFIWVFSVLSVGSSKWEMCQYLSTLLIICADIKSIHLTGRWHKWDHLSKLDVRQGRWLLQLWAHYWMKCANSLVCSQGRGREMCWSVAISLIRGVGKSGFFRVSRPQ